MFKEPEAMRQIHEIQEKIYEETKCLEEANRNYGLKLRKVSCVR